MTNTTRTVVPPPSGQIETLGGEARDNNDQVRLRHGRHRHEGMMTGIYHQPAPMLFTRDGHNVPLGDMYRGRSAFLCCGGPSFKLVDQQKLASRGIVTYGINNISSVYRTHFWTCVDDPAHFVEQIWLDPGIIKLVPLDHMEKHIWIANPDGTFKQAKTKVGDCPAVFGFRRNEVFKPEQWLYEDSFNWGCHSEMKDQFDLKGSRSVMYVAIRMLFFLGFRNVYIVGADFKMKKENERAKEGAGNYAFAQNRHDSSISGNNSSYRIMNIRFKALRPFFEQEQFNVYNCTPDSGLDAFDRMDFDAAVEAATKEIRATPLITENRYDQEYLARNKAQPANPSPAPAKPAPGPAAAATTATAKSTLEQQKEKARKIASIYNEEDRVKAQEELNKRRAELAAAKKVHDALVESADKAEMTSIEYASKVQELEKLVVSAREKMKEAERRKNEIHGIIKHEGKWIKA